MSSVISIQNGKSANIVRYLTVQRKTKTPCHTFLGQYSNLRLTEIFCPAIVAVEGPKQKGYLEHLFPSPFMTQHSSLIDKFLLQMGCVTRRARVGRCAHMGSRPAAEACGWLLQPRFMHTHSTHTQIHTHTHTHTQKTFMIK